MPLGNGFHRHEDGGLSNVMRKRSRATGYPQENIRMEISKEIARTHIRNREGYVKDAPTERILTVDEVGCQEWSGRKKRDVIIPH
jgi:hypothetical protein